MLSKTMLEALNEQINREFGSAYKYLSASAWSEAENLPGFAHWMRMQWREEIEHGMKIFAYVNDQGSHVELRALDKPIIDFGSPLKLAETLVQFEEDQTGSINKLYDRALEEGDKATQVFLHWFIDEQVEEEKQAAYLLSTLKMIGDSGHALIMLDRELARREG